MPGVGFNPSAPIAFWARALAWSSQHGELTATTPVFVITSWHESVWPQIDSSTVGGVEDGEKRVYSVSFRMMSSFEQGVVR